MMPESDEVDASVRHWKTRVLLAVAFASLVILAYVETFADMVAVWSMANKYNHCFLVPFIAGYMAWEKRYRLNGCTMETAPLALPLIAVNVLLWLIGELVSIAFFHHVAVVGLLIAGIWLILGTQILRAFLFPVVYLYFAVPEGDFLVPYLQDWTAQVLVAMLRISNVPVYLEGRHLAIPSGNFVVAEACSGINYLIAAISVGSMFAYLRYESVARRIAFMLLAIVVPLVANGIRAYGIVMIADMSDYQYAMGVDHFIYGWVFFGIVIFALFALGNLFAEESTDVVATEPKYFANLREGPWRGGTLVTAVALLLLPTLADALSDDSLLAGPEIVAPTVEGWSRIDTDNALGGVFPGADQSIHARYREPRGGPEVAVDIYYFARQFEGRELISHGHRIYENDFRVLGFGIRNAPESELLERVNELQLRRGTVNHVVWYWYDIAGRRAATRFGAKLAEGLGRLSGDAAGAAIVVSMTAEDEDPAYARARLAAFVDSAGLGLSSLQRKR